MVPTTSAQARARCRYGAASGAIQGNLTPMPVIATTQRELLRSVAVVLRKVNMPAPGPLAGFTAE